MISKRCCFLRIGVAGLMFSLFAVAGWACTGISLQATDGSYVIGRTIEWGSSELHSECVVIPRGCGMTSYTPSGVNGVRFTALYGVVGISLVQKEFLCEGVNEKGLSVGLFYFPGYGAYPAYDAAKNDETLSDVQLVSYVLTQCANIDEAIEKLSKLRIVSIDVTEVPETVHWRLADASGRQVVLELLEGEAHFFENKIGVLTNSPSYPWHLTNLNNYVNLYPGNAPEHELNGVKVSPFGAGSGFLGLPGDMTSPSRFVRAAFCLSTTPMVDSAERCVSQAFHLLSSFTIPIGFMNKKELVPDIPCATQWTVVIDLSHCRLYYRTMYNAVIRCIQLKQIDFDKVKYQAVPLDKEQRTPVENLSFVYNGKETVALPQAEKEAAQATDSIK